VSPNGWTDYDATFKWFTTSFVPQSKKRNISGHPILLVLDGHNSHVTEELLTSAKTNRVHIVKLIPHATHALQPLDVGVHGPLQRQWTTFVNNLACERELSVTRDTLLGYYACARTGVFPQEPHNLEVEKKRAAELYLLCEELTKKKKKTLVVETPAIPDPNNEEDDSETEPENEEDFYGNESTTDDEGIIPSIGYNPKVSPEVTNERARKGIRSAFRRTGIWPLNRSKITASQIAPSQSFSSFASFPPSCPLDPNVRPPDIEQPQQPVSALEQEPISNDASTDSIHPPSLINRRHSNIPPPLDLSGMSMREELEALRSHVQDCRHAAQQAEAHTHIIANKYADAYHSLHALKKKKRTTAVIDFESRLVTTDDYIAELRRQKEKKEAEEAEKVRKKQEREQNKIERDAEKERKRVEKVKQDEKRVLDKAEKDRLARIRAAEAAAKKALRDQKKLDSTLQSTLHPPVKRKYTRKTTKKSEAAAGEGAGRSGGGGAVSEEPNQSGNQSGNILSAVSFNARPPEWERRLVTNGKRFYEDFMHGDGDENIPMTFDYQFDSFSSPPKRHCAHVPPSMPIASTSSGAGQPILGYPTCMYPM